MNAANHQSNATTNNAGRSLPHPAATHQRAASETRKTVAMNGSQLLMVWNGTGWINHVMGPAS